MGVNPTDILHVILHDFFQGWKPTDRPKFYRQRVTFGNRSVVVTPEQCETLRRLINPTLATSRLMKSDEARRLAFNLDQIVEQL